MKCSNNLKQIGLAVHNYHDVNGQFPLGKGPAYPGGRRCTPGWSVHSQLLPFIEQDNLFKSINFNLPPETPGMGGVGRVHAGLPEPDPASQRRRLPDRGRPCSSARPTRPPLPPTGPARTTTSPTRGRQFLCDLTEAQPSTIAPSEQPDGPFYYLSKVKMADVTDGTSNTACSARSSAGSGNPEPADRHVHHARTRRRSTTPTTPAPGSTRRPPPPLTSKQGASWVMGEMCCTTYNHVRTPNTITCAGAPASPATCPTWRCRCRRPAGTPAG